MDFTGRNTEDLYTLDLGALAPRLAQRRPDLFRGVSRRQA